MCGIIAIAGNKTSEIKDGIVTNMLSTLLKRGPDAHDFRRFDKCVVGQTRLSIIDLATGDQPMRDNSKPLTIVFNGEIYNYKELRSELEKKNHKFSTQSDTEVILKSYVEYGEDCPKYLDGMFAFAIWDEEKKELFTARDRFGKKPLYYTFLDDKSIIFASEIKAIFAGGLIKGEIDWTTIDNYLTLMYVPPWKSIYKNVQVIPPASFATYKNNKLGEPKRYWSIPRNPQKPTYEEAKARIKELIGKAVKKRMVADVEIGSLLSGGVDSTLITYLAQSYMNRPIKSFSVGYKGHNSELPYAKQASERIGTDHYTLEARSDLCDELEKVIEYMDEPHADTSNFPQHLISELAGSKVKVALSGDGADELFMGYGWYWKYFNTTKLLRIKNALFSNQFNEYIKNISIFSRLERKKLWRDDSAINHDIYPKTLSSIKNNTGKINLFDLEVYLPGQLLTKIDRTGMMHSLEVRSPFLDKDLVEYVYNIPAEYKMDGQRGKIILKDILSDLMPIEFANRRKQGFGAPIAEWLKEDKMRALIKKILSNQSNHMYEKISYDEVQSLLKKPYDDSKLIYKIWTLLCLGIWFEYHEKYQI